MRILKYLILLPALLLISCGNSKDSASKRPSPAIISLTPSVTETLCALGLENNLVGVSNYCDYPDSVKSLPKCGNLFNANIEQLVSLKPDMVVLSQSAGKYLKNLDPFGIQVIQVEQDSVEKIINSIKTLGKHFNKIKQADSIVTQLNTAITSHTKARQEFTEKRILITLAQNFDEPVNEAYICGSDTFYDGLLNIIGAQNVAGHLKGYKILTVEAILALKPDIIIAQTAHADDSQLDKIRASWKEFLKTAGLTENKFQILSGSFTARPGPRFPQTLKALSKLIKNAEGSK